MNPNRYHSKQEEVRDVMERLRNGNESGQRVLVMGNDGKMRVVSASEANKPGYTSLHQEDLKVSFKVSKDQVPS